MEFKDNLRFLRRSNNMSQDELAAMLGYKSFTTVQKWEDGSAFPRVSTLNRIAEIFNVDVDHLLNLNIRSSQVAVPILGEVKAGYDMYADEDIYGYDGSGGDYDRHIVPYLLDMESFLDLSGYSGNGNVRSLIGLSHIHGINKRSSGNCQSDSNGNYHSFAFQSSRHPDPTPQTRTSHTVPS